MQFTKEWKIERLSPEWRPNVFSKYSTNFIFSTQATKEWKIGFHLNGDIVSFQKTQTYLFISTQATEEWKIERISPEWGPSVFSKYLTLFSYFHTGYIRMENRLSP